MCVRARVCVRACVGACVCLCVCVGVGVGVCVCLCLCLCLCLPARPCACACACARAWRIRRYFMLFTVDTTLGAVVAYRIHSYVVTWVRLVIPSLSPRTHPCTHTLGVCEPTATGALETLPSACYPTLRYQVALKSPECLLCAPMRAAIPTAMPTGVPLGA